MTRRTFSLLLGLLVASTTIVIPSAQAVRQLGRSTGFPGAVYTMSNAIGGNAVLMFDRLADGRLVPAGNVATGGLGTGGGLGNQGALTLTRHERWLLAVNARSDTVSVFDVGRHGLRLADVEPGSGDQPISVTEYRNLVYVLNAGSDSITEFRLGRDGRLHR